MSVPNAQPLISVMIPVYNGEAYLGEEFIGVLFLDDQRGGRHHVGQDHHGEGDLADCR